MSTVPEQLVSGREGLDRYFDKVAVTEELGSEVNLIFHVAAPGSITR